MNFDSIDDKGLEKLRRKIVDEQERRKYTGLEELRAKLEQAAKDYINAGGAIRFAVDIYTDYEYNSDEDLPSWDNANEVSFISANYNSCVVNF